MRYVGLALAIVLASACGPSDRMEPPGGGGGGGGGGSGSSTGNGDGCSDSAKLVYVVDQSNTFSKFDPSTRTFTDLGTLSCPTNGGIFGANPFSMGVDRNTIAWVLYDDGELFRVDITNNLACTATAWSSSSGLTQFGMGFSTDTAGGTTDTLFVAGGSTVGSSSPSMLAKLNTGSMSAQTVGTVQGWPELTGTGSAQLWGWFPDPDMPVVAQIDKSTGNLNPKYDEPSLAGTPMAWAFAFWGGDFWVFLQRDTDSATTVYQIDGMTGSVKGHTDTNTRTIVGAGVSTCAPVVIQ
jgi:hypothetical protein